MNYLKEKGIIYDCIYYCVKYFEACNNKNIFESYNNKYYKSVNDENVHPPESLYPFFHHDASPSVISEYFEFHLSDGSNIESFMDFIDLIGDREKLKDFIIDYVFSDIKKGERPYIKDFTDISFITSSLKNAGYDNFAITAYTLLFTNFESAVNDLIKYLIELNLLINKIHNKYDGLIRECFDYLTEREKAKKISGIFSIEVKNYLKADMSICLLNDKINFISKSKNNIFFIVGVNYKNHLYEVFNFKQSSVKSFAHAIGNSTRYRIIELFTKSNTYLSAEDLCEKLKLSLGTIKKHINILHKEGILIASESEEVLGRTVYNIDGNYFSYLYPKMVSYFNLYNVNEIF